MSNLKKLILVGPESEVTAVVKKFAKQNNLDFAAYTENEWATLEEVEQYIQDEELSTQIVDLPIGRNEDVSLNSITKKHIQKILHLKKLNVNEVARTLKISRATLYRKMEKNGLSIKKEREKILKRSQNQAA